MSPTVKRIALIIGFLILVGAIGFGLWTLFRRNSVVTPGQTTDGTTNPVGNLPGSSTRTSTTAGGGAVTTPGTLPTAGSLPGTTGPTYYRPTAVTQLSTDFATFPSAGSNGAFRYHNQSDGKFYKVNTDGSISALSSQIFYNVQNVTWAKANKAVIEYPDKSKIIYDFDKQKQVSLPNHWEDFSFSPDSTQVAAKSIGLSPDNRWLLITRDDGTGTKLLEPLGTNGDKVDVAWSPSGQTVAFSRTGQPQGGDRQEIYLLGQNNENFKSLVVEGLDFVPNWSTTGKKLLYSVDNAQSNYKPELWITEAFGDQIGGNRNNLKVNTWANKCTFADDNTVYCAVPRTLPDGAGMVPAIAKDTPDDLYRIDLRTGAKSSIPLDKEYTIDQISYDSVNKKLEFTDTHLTGAFQVNL